MRLIDKIALNRLITLILNFILSVMKIFAPTTDSPDDTDNKPKPKRKPLLPWRRTDENNN